MPLYDHECLMMVFGRLEGEISDTAITALAVLAYNLSLNTNPVIESGAAVEALSFRESWLPSPSNS